LKRFFTAPVAGASEPEKQKKKKEKESWPQAVSLRKIAPQPMPIKSST
jgi:hypothetical protein